MGTLDPPKIAYKDHPNASTRIAQTGMRTVRGMRGRCSHVQDHYDDHSSISHLKLIKSGSPLGRTWGTSEIHPPIDDHMRSVPLLQVTGHFALIAPGHKTPCEVLEEHEHVWLVTYVTCDNT